MNKKEKFDVVIKKSLKYQKHILDDGVYYDQSYFKALTNILRERDLYDSFKREYELYEGGRYRICSVGSSARLCFLYFQANKNLEFEKVVKTGISSHI